MNGPALPDPDWVAELNDDDYWAAHTLNDRLGTMGSVVLDGRVGANNFTSEQGSAVVRAGEFALAKSYEAYSGEEKKKKTQEEMRSMMEARRANGETIGRIELKLDPEFVRQHNEEAIRFMVMVILESAKGEGGPMNVCSRIFYETHAVAPEIRDTIKTFNETFGQNLVVNSRTALTLDDEGRVVFIERAIEAYVEDLT